MNQLFDGLDPKISYFLKCARAPTLRSAAFKIGVTQAALSASIAKLEKELGARLFDRSKAGVKLTARGEALLALFENSRESIETGLRGLLGGNEKRSLRVGCVTHVGVHELLPIVRSKRAELSPLQIYFGYSLASYEAVREGRLDFAFVTWTDRPKGVESWVIREDTKAIVGLKRLYPQLEKARKREELRDLPWVLQPKPQYDWSELMSRDRSGYLVHDVFAQRELILRGAGIGEAQLSVFSEAERKKLAICKIPPAHQEVRLYAICKKGLDAAAQKQMQLLAACLKG